jgi:UDP-N-acetylmuramate dehydrogenase
MELLQDVQLKNKNTFRIGGIARWYTEPASEIDIREAVRWSLDKGKPLFVLGKGSNVLISDNGWPGLVINLSAHFTKVEWNLPGAICQSGALLNTVVAEAVQKGLGGGEQLSGIPGTIGGGVIMNAGAYEQCIADIVADVRYCDLTNGKIESRSKEEMHFGYRTSALHSKRVIVLSTQLSFIPSDPHKLMETREKILALRKQKQPLDLPNCGSVFKRPPGLFAGTLIEQCGLKGYRIGDMEISSKHANFIVNHGQGTAGEVRRLIYKVQKDVYEKAGVLLEPEVLFIGDFDEQLYKP